MACIMRAVHRKSENGIYIFRVMIGTTCINQITWKLWFDLRGPMRKLSWSQTQTLDSQWDTMDSYFLSADPHGARNPRLAPVTCNGIDRARYEDKTAMAIIKLWSCPVRVKKWKCWQITPQTMPCHLFARFRHWQKFSGKHNSCH